MNKTLLHHFKSIRDEKYTLFLKKIEDTLNKEKDKGNLIDQVSTLETVLAKIDYLLVYTRNIVRMGYGNDDIENEISKLYKLMDKAEERLDVVLNQIADDKDLYLQAERYHYYMETIWSNKKNEIQLPDEMQLSLEKYQKIINRRIKGVSLATIWNKYKENNDIANQSLVQMTEELLKYNKTDLSKLYVDIKRSQIEMVKKSGYKDTLSYIAKEYFLDEKSMHSLVENMDNFITKLGGDECNIDNMLKNTESYGKYHIDFDEAIDFLADCFGKLDNDFGKMILQARDENWVDFKTRIKKMNGSYTNNIILTGESVICMTYKGTINDKCKLAHELGHAYHGRCVSEQGYLCADFSVITAEIFGLFCENYAFYNFIVNKKFFEYKKDYYADILKTYLTNIKAFMFEYRTFEELNKEETIDPSITFERVLKEIGIKPKNIIDKNEWIFRTQNFFPEYFYYNFVYIIGEVVSIDMVLKIIKGKIDFSNVKDMLVESGKQNVDELLRYIDVDLCKNDNYDILKKLEEIWESTIITDNISTEIS